MRSCPDAVPLSVQPFGYALAVVTERNHISVTLDECKINGVLYRAHIHLHLWADGSWNLGQETEKNEYTRHRNASYLSRVGVYADPTSAAREGLRRKVTTAVVLALSQIPAEVFEEAERRRVENELEKITETIETLRRNLMIAENTEHELQVELHLLGGPRAED